MHQESDIFCLRDVKKGENDGSQIFSVNGTRICRRICRRDPNQQTSAFPYGSVSDLIQPVSATAERDDLKDNKELRNKEDKFSDGKESGEQSGQFTDEKSKEIYEKFLEEMRMDLGNDAVEAALSKKQAVNKNDTSNLSSNMSNRQLSNNMSKNAKIDEEEIYSVHGTRSGRISRRDHNQQSNAFQYGSVSDLTNSNTVDEDNGGYDQFSLGRSTEMLDQYSGKGSNDYLLYNEYPEKKYQQLTDIVEDALERKQIKKQLNKPSKMSKPLDKRNMALKPGTIPKSRMGNKDMPNDRRTSKQVSNDKSKGLYDKFMEDMKKDLGPNVVEPALQRKQVNKQLHKPNRIIKTQDKLNPGSRPECAHKVGKAKAKPIMKQQKPEEPISTSNISRNPLTGAGIEYEEQKKQKKFIKIKGTKKLW